MRLQGLLTSYRTWLGLLVLGAVLGAAISFAVAVNTPPGYVGQVTLLVTPPTTATQITFSDVEVTQALAPTFAQLSTTAPILQRVIASTKVDLDVETLARAVTTHVPTGTSLIDIAVTNKDPATAAALANAIAAELVNSSGQGFQRQASALKVALTVVDPAVPPPAPNGLGILPRTALGGAIGLFLSISLAFFVKNVGRGAQSVGRGVQDVGRAPETFGRSASSPERDRGDSGRGGGFGRGSETSVPGNGWRTGPSVVEPTPAPAAPDIRRPRDPVPLVGAPEHADEETRRPLASARGLLARLVPGRGARTGAREGVEFEGVEFDAAAPEPAAASERPEGAARVSAWATPPSQPAEQSAAPVGDAPEESPAPPRRRKPGDTAPDFLLRTPTSVTRVADDFFDGLIRRVEGDR